MVDKKEIALIILFPLFGITPKGRKKKAHLAFFFEVFPSFFGVSSLSGVS
jgi:hypothetical protein